MATKIIIHRGTNQIGGCVTEIKTDNKRIFIDFGEELPGTDSGNHELKIEGLNYAGEKCDGVLFTHYHGDHIGLFHTIQKDVPLYMGECTRKIMLTIHETLRDNEAIGILRDDKRIKPVDINKVIPFGKEISVTPFLVDHSAYDAYMFLIKTPDLTILHTGDYRNHGYRGIRLTDTIHKYITLYGKQKIDVLITEGTMMNRQSETVMTEWEMQQKAVEYFKQNRYIFLLCSSTNLDSLWSFYKAAERCGMRFYANYYVYNQIRNFTEYAGSQTQGLYHFKTVYCVDWDFKLDKANMTQEEFMREKGFVIVIKADEGYKKWIERFADLNPKIIYSMWEGYLDPKMKAYDKKLADFLKPYEPDRVLKLHTSGHATTKCIEEVISAVNPNKAIIPIHTENKAAFTDLNISEDLKQRIVYLNDGEEFAV
ncbi:MAG TPA: MBL fold metallo-hydrolase [Mobilitalea sp.]|nr:MBL fold metallo-hydrolase [Mobilitalea sp.]